MLTAVGIKYAYYNLNVSKIKLEVFEENIKALNLYKKYYFKTMSVIPCPPASWLSLSISESLIMESSWRAMDESR